MMARRSDHSSEPLGDLELRGVPEPVPSVTVLWDPVAPDAVLAMPDRLRPDMDLMLAGRVEQTEALGLAFKSAAAGERRVTFLAGEPGIGKTRLASELAVDVHGRALRPARRGAERALAAVGRGAHLPRRARP
jgi:hypothetical protein